MANVAKTPSAVNKQEESLEHIELIVGNISEAVNMSEESLDSINENIVDGIVNKLDLHSTKLVAMTNSLMAMSGYMLGHKGINEKTSHATLLSKVKNTAPIFGEITIPETLFTLIDSIKEAIMQSKITESTVKTISKSETTNEISNVLTENTTENINVNFSINNKADLDSLYKLLVKLPDIDAKGITAGLSTLYDLIDRFNGIKFNKVDNQLGESLDVLISTIMELYTKIDSVKVPSANMSFIDSVAVLGDLIDRFNSIKFNKVDNQLGESLDVLISTVMDLYTKIDSVKVPSTNTAFVDSVAVLGDLIDRFNGIKFNKVDNQLGESLDVLISTVMDLYTKIDSVKVPKANLSFIDSLNSIANVISTIGPINVDELDTNIVGVLMNIENITNQLVEISDRISSKNDLYKNVEAITTTLNLVNNSLNDISFDVNVDIEPLLVCISKLNDGISKISVVNIDDKILDSLGLVEKSLIDMTTIIDSIEMVPQININEEPINNIQKLYDFVNKYINELDKLNSINIEISSLDKFNEFLNNFNNTYKTLSDNTNSLNDIKLDELKISEHVFNNFKTINDFIKNINELGNLNIIDPKIINSITNANSLKYTLDNLIKLYDSLNNIDIQNISIDNQTITNNFNEINYLVNAINNCGNILLDKKIVENIDKQNISEVLDKILNLFNNLKSVKNIQQITISKNIINNLDNINKFVDELNKVSVKKIKLNTDSLQTIINIGKYLSDINIELNNIKPIYDFERIFDAVKQIEDFENTLKNTKKIKINYTVLDNLNYIYDLIDKINNINRIPLYELSLDSNTINNSITDIYDIISSFSTFPKTKIDIKNIENTITSLNTVLNSLSKLEISKLNDMDFSDLEDVIYSIDPLLDFIYQINNLQNVNIKNLDNTINVFKDTSKLLVELNNYISKLQFVDIKDKITDIKSVTNSLNVYEKLLKSFNPSLKTFIKIDILASFLSKENNVENAINVLNNVAEELNNLIVLDSDIEQAILTNTVIFDNVTKMLYSFAPLVEASNNIKKVKNLVSVIENINDVIAYLHDIKSVSIIVENIKNIDNVFSSFKSTLENIIILEDILKDIEKVFIDLNSSVKLLNTVLSELDAIDVPDSLDNRIESLDNIMTLLNSLFKSYIKIGVLSIFTQIFEKPVVKTINGLNNIIDSISDLHEVDSISEITNNLSLLSDTFKSISKILLSSILIGIIAIPAAIGLTAVAASLKLINIIIVTIDKIFAKGTINENALNNINNVNRTIITLGALMFVAALTGAFVMKRFAEIMGFAATLSLFMLTIIGTTILLGKFAGKEYFKSLENIHILIITSAAIMLLGAAFYKTNLWKSSILFGVVLSAFITLVLMPFIIFGRFLKSSIGDAKQMSILIITSTLVLMLGALFMKSGLWKEALQFTGILSLFILGVLTPFIIFALVKGSLQKEISFLTSLVIWSAAVLMLGALFIRAGMQDDAITFATILGTFIAGIVLAFTIGGQRLNAALKNVGMLTLLMTVGGLLLMIGSAIIDKYGSENAIVFATTLDGMIIILAATLYMLSKAKLDPKTLVGMGVIAATVAIGAASMNIMGDAFQKFGDWKNALIMAGILVGTVLAFGGLLIGLGALSVVPFFWAGLGAMAAIAGIILTVAISFKNIAEAMQVMTSLKGQKIDEAGLNGLIDSFKNIGEKLESIEDSISPRKIKRVAKSMTAVAEMMSKLGISVQDISNLKVATAWDKDGNGISFIQLGEQDFKNAATNIKEIITTLGNAIITTYKEAPEGMFDGTGVFGLGKSPFDKVVRSCTGMGKMISVIAKSVSDAANLTVATLWNRNGDPISFRQLKDTDFKNAATNIKEIITTLGNAIITTYNEAPEGMFEGTGIFGLGKSPFDKVVRSCTGMGKMISGIAKAVSDAANLTVADKWDNQGNPISFKQLREQDFKNAATNIKEIITTLGGAIIETYNSNKELFEVPDISVSAGLFSIKIPGKGKTPFEKTVLACTTMGNMISTIANGVKDMADLKVATKWDSNGNPIDWRHLTENDFTLAGDQIGKIISTIGKKISEVYEADEIGIFKQGLTFKDGKFEGGDTPIMRVLTAATTMGVAMSSIAGGVKDMADLRIAEYDINGKPTGNFIEPDFEKAAKNTGEVVSSLARAIIDTYNDPKNKGMFDEVVTYTTTSKGWGRKETHKHVSDSPIVKVLSSAQYLGQFISDCAAAIKEISDLHFVDSNGNKVTIDIIKEGDSIKQKINKIVTCLGNAITESYASGKDTYFNTEWVGYQHIPTSVETIKKIVEGTTKSISSIHETVKLIDKPEEFNTNWDKLVKGIVSPFESLSTENVDKAINFNDSVKQSTEGIVTSINSLDIAKVDKFVELTRELNTLSDNMGDMGQVISALNGRINETLGNLSDKLEIASKAIKESDEAQDKRQKKIKENTKELKEIMKTPLKVNFTADKETLGNIDDKLKANTGGTNNTPDPSSSGSTSSNNNSNINIAAIENLAGILQEILNTLREK